MRHRSLTICLLALSLASSPSARGDEAPDASLAARRAELEKIERSLRERFDGDRNGWLDAAEREAMRAAHGGGDRRRRRGGFPWPPEVIERFDANGDGRLDDAESRTAGETLKRREREIQDEYDQNDDGRLDGEEFEALGEAYLAGKVRDLPFWWKGRFGGLRQGKLPWETFDRDGDGRFDSAELAAARATLAKPRAERVETSPSRRPVEQDPKRERDEDDENDENDENDESDESDESDETPRVAPVKFSRAGGFCDEAIELSLRSDSEGAEIRYTLDCSEPRPDHGELYREPILIERSTVVRAAVFHPELRARRSKTATFIFLDDVLRQSRDGLPPVGAPLRWGRNVVDYGMDPEIVDDPRYRDAMRPALESLPSISLVLDPRDLFGPDGIYAYARRSGREAERPASFEILYSEGFEPLEGLEAKSLSLNCGARIRGGFSRTGSNPKHGFRLFFRKAYGPGKLRARLFDSGGAEAFDNLDLRCSQNYSWNLGGDARGLFVRDQFSRDTQLAMGQPAARGEYYHLYLNGQYWGLFNTCERIEASYGASYLEGEKEDFDAIKVERERGTSPTDGDITAWESLCEYAKKDLSQDATYQRLLGNRPDGRRDPDLPRLLEVENLIDYLLVIFWAGNLDAPVTIFAGNRAPNNWYGLRNRQGKDGFRFFIWDAEHTLLDVEEDRTGPFPEPWDVARSHPQWIWQACLANAEFRVAVGDRIERHFRGALSTEAMLARFDHRVGQIEKAVLGESARWGDADSSKSEPLTLEHWKAEVRRVREEYIPRRGLELRHQLWRQGLIPEVRPPRAERSGGELDLRAPRGEVYFTTDGSDPRQIGGKPSPSARVYAGKIEPGEGVLVKARARFEGGNWSALLVEEANI